MRRGVAGAVLTAVIALLSGCRTPSDETLARLFFARNARGSLLLSAVKGSAEYRVNNSRLETRFPPDALYFMPETLIALEAGAVPDADALESWDGEDRGLAEWNRDQSLKTAFHWSCDWFFDRIAARTEARVTARHLKAMQFGNADIGNNQADFPSNGTLAVSSEELARFLKALYRESLPIRREYQQQLKQMMHLRDSPRGGAVYGKTAWTPDSPARHAWFVGFVESRVKGAWVFVLNLTVEHPADTAFRQEIVFDALKEKGIFP